MKARHLSLSLTFFGLLFGLLVAVGALAEAGPAPSAPAATLASAPAAAAPAQPAAAPVLQLALQPSAAAPAWGEVFTYTLVMRNTGDAAAPGAEMTNALPDGLTYLSGTLQATSGAADYLFTERAIRWQGDLPTAAPVTLTYAAQLVTQEYIYNTAVLTHPLAAAAASATSSPADVWGAAEVIAEGRVFDYKLASYRNIAVDSQGRPRIAYGGESGLYYATFANGAWTSVQVPVTPTRPTKAALVLDNQDRARIAFYDDAWGYIWLARETGAAVGAESAQAADPAASAWSLERVSTKYFGSNFMEKVDIQLDSAGRLHLVYYDGDAPSGHYYTVYDGGAWRAPTLAAASSTCAFAVDGNDIPHLACKRSIYLSLYTYDGATWTYEDVASGLDADKVIYAPGLAYAGTIPHVTFLRPNNGLYHATKNPNWTITQVDVSPWGGSQANTPLVTATAVRGGQVAVAYAWTERQTGSSIYTETIRVASRSLTGAIWMTESVDAVVGDALTSDWARPALALDATGRAHLAYYYRTDAALRHAAQTNSFTLYTVDESLALGDNAALDVGSDGGTHVAYLANGLRYAHSPAASTIWTKTLAVAGVHNAALLDLAVDGAHTPHVVYQAPFAPLYHAVLNGGTWTVRAVDAPGVAANPALDADAAGTADVAYLALAGANLAVRYGHFVASTWTTATLAVAGPNQPMHRQSPRLVAQGGKVYVLYADCTAYQDWADYPITLTLKTLADGAWGAQTLHTFTGQCNDRLAYHLLGDSAGRLAAVAVIADAQGHTQEVTFWPEEAGATQTTASAPEVSAAESQGLLGYDYGRYRQVRGDGLETLSVSGGQKQAIYQDRSGAASAPVNLASTLDTSTYLQDLACYGQNAAALERSWTRNALAVERARPRPRPRPEANAVKRETTRSYFGVYPTERITYTLELEWLGQEYAPIVIYDPINPSNVTYVEGSLTWGAHIAQCLYSNGVVQCVGEFPPTDVKLTTRVQFSVRVKCDAHNYLDEYRRVADTGYLINTARVRIGAFDFMPQVKTEYQPPFALRASSPTIVTAGSPLNKHDLLLYTVSGAHATDALLTECPASAFEFTVQLGNWQKFPMRNDGVGPDFQANDWHHSFWLEPAQVPNDAPPIFFVPKLNLHTRNGYYLRASPVSLNVVRDGSYSASRPQLLVLTDLRALFDEFAVAQPRVNPHLQDANHNRILDYYDAVERLYRYALNHQGAVIDVRRSAYAPTNFDYYASFADREQMAQRIKELLSARWPLRPYVNDVAIIGTDAVVPYMRLPVLPGAADETRFASSLGLDANPTVNDIGAFSNARKGYWMSDLAYVRDAIPGNGYGLDWGIGRIFRDKPLDLVALIDQMEQPLVLDHRLGQGWVAQTRNDALDFEELVEKFVRPSLYRYYGGLLSLRYHPSAYPSVGNYPPGGYWLNGNWGLRNDNQPWTVEDLSVVKELADVLVFVGHGNEDGPTDGSAEVYVGGNDLVGLFGQTFLVISTGCHNGLLPAAKDSGWSTNWFPNATLRANAALLGTTSYDASKNFLGMAQDAYHDKLRRLFLWRLFSPRYATLGQVLQGAVNAYALAGNGAYDDNDYRTLNTAILFGLPTQPIQRPAAQARAASAPATSPAHPAVTLSAPNATSDIDRSVVIQHWEVVTDTAGRLGFWLPHNGGLAAPAHAPATPVIYHTYLLPLDAENVSVTLTDAQSHPWGAAVDLSPSTVVEKSFGPQTGAYTLTNPYPATVLAYTVYTDALALRVDVALAPLSYDPNNRRVTLYDRLDYRLSYTAPVTWTVQSVLVNGGAAVDVGQTALPIAFTLNAAVPFSGTAYWEIYDTAGVLLDDGAATVAVGAGAHQVEISSDLPGWPPGPKQVVVALVNGALENKDPVVAAGHALFNVQGRSLTLETDRNAYGAADAAALLTATVRDETGAAVAGQAANLTARLDGAAVALAWQGGSVYTAALNLTGVAAGQHFISVTLGSRMAEAAFIVDRQPPTSTLAGPTVVASPTFTVTLRGGDDLSGVGEYIVQYRIGAGGAWTDWLTRTTGWDYATGGPVSLTLTFGPTEPAALQPGQTVHFRTRAADRAGNREAEHPAADLSVTYGAPRREIYLPLIMRQ